MTALFFYGTLRHRPLLEIVLGDHADGVTVEQATLPDHAVHWVRDQPFPILVRAPGRAADGLLVRDLSEDAVARLDFYEGGFAFVLRSLPVQSEHGETSARVYFNSDDRWHPGAPWSLADWVARWGDITLAAARDMMAKFGTEDAARMQALLPFLRARAWARQLATRRAPTKLRSDPGPGAVELTPHPAAGFDGFFGLRVFDLRHRRFDGDWSPIVTREAFVAYDAALVLPYDPATDRVMLIEQFRYGPLQRGDPTPWVLEPIAGLVDAGEEPAETARREAMEEAGVAVSELIAMQRGYASPGYSTEFFHCFLAPCDLNAHAGGLGGVDAENEDIRSHVIPFEDAMALVDTGETTVLPLVTMLLWLSRWRERRHASA